MKRQIFAGMAVAGGLMLWTTTASFADNPASLSTAAQTALAGVAKCESDQLAKLGLTGTTLTEPERDAKEKIQDFADRGVDRITDADNEAVELLADFPGATLDLSGFFKAVVQSTCNAIDGVKVKAKAMDDENEDENEVENDNNGDHHGDRDRGAEHRGGDHRGGDDRGGDR